jgi:hypothetical protein
MLQDNQFSHDNHEGDTLPDNNVNSKEGDMPETGKPDLSALTPEVRQYIDGLEAEVGKRDNDDTEDIFKGLTPEAVELVKRAQADAESASAKIAKMEEEREVQHYTDVAKSLSNLPVEEKTGVALRALAKADGESYEEVVRVLKAADSLLGENSVIFKSLGTAGAPTGDSDIEKRAEEISKAEGITIEKARTKVYEQDEAAYVSATEGK